MPENKDTSQQDFYEKLRTSTEGWFKEHDMEKGADYVLLAPDFFYLLCKLVVDEDVAVNEKLKLGLAITYFLSPIDCFPEALFGTIGFVDDVALTAYVLNSILSTTPAKVVERYWLGKNNLLDEIEGILQKADDVIGGGLWRKIMEYFDDSVGKNPNNSSNEKVKEKEEVEVDPIPIVPPALPKKATAKKATPKKHTAKKSTAKKKTAKSKATKTAKKEAPK